MNEYVICTRRYGENETPLQPVITVTGYGFAHALERALHRHEEWPRESEVGDLVVVKIVTEDTMKVFKILELGPDWMCARP